MNRAVPVVLSAAALVASACEPRATIDPVTSSSSSTEQAIINGAACGPEVEPTAVAIMLDATLSFGGDQSFDITTVLCTGTLIAPDVVLLAAHCVDTSLLTGGFGEITREDFYVTFDADLSAFAEQAELGGEPLPIPSTAVPVRGFVAHEGFNINELSADGTVGVENDIALLFLEVPITTVQPEVVITTAEAAQLGVGDAVTIAGWGQRGAARDAPAGIKQCGATTLDELGPALMQIGAASTSIRKCHGDSGGPTYIEVDTTASVKRRVIGVTSRAYDESDCAKGGVDTRVDAYLDWLGTEMTGACAAGDRAWCDVTGIIPASFYEPAPAAEGEGEGEGGGRDRGDDEEDPADDCSHVPVNGVFALSLVTLLARRRRR